MKAFVRTWVLFGVLMILCTACGKQIPKIDPALLQSKSSLLVVTDPTLSADARQRLQNALTEWRNTKQLAFEWIPDVTSLTAEQLDKIKTTAYDYVFVAGHSLVQSTLPQAEEITNRKWLMMDNQVLRQTLAVKGSHITLKAVQESRLRSEWEEWVRQQIVSDRAIEWVTTSAYPIPSEWAPAEEAETIHLADAEGWQQQFQFAVKAHRPAWIAAFAPLDAAQLQRLRSAQVPVVDMNKTIVDLQWNELLLSLQQTMSTGTWKPGLQPYEEREIRIQKNL
ncbi:hypothetical protein WMW72_19850 [Paenibacillus filicis]|uniref:Uncharacterized protein n=2 Tax=Paenibacillus filicis TaxID=669464 RepID=A0ABU9DMS5_9BACL